MIKVLNVISDSNIGGAGKVLLNYVKYSDKKEFETYIALPKGSKLVKPFKELNANIIELDGLAERSFHKDDVKLLKKVISNLRPDIVHTHGSLSGRIAGKQCGCKVIYTRHSAFPVSAKMKYPPGRWVSRFVNEHYTDHIIAVSPAAEENLLDMGISKKYITTMMNGVAPINKSSNEEVLRFKESFGIKADEFVMILLARIEEYKGHGIVVDAAKRLKADGKKFKIIFAGEGNYKAKLMQKIKDEGLEDEFVFTGFLEDVSLALSAADLQLNASFGTETSSLSVLEGFSIGLPAAVSSYGGNPCLVDDGENGLIFENKNPKALHDAVERLMDDEKLLSLMGDKSKEIYASRFSGEVFAKNVEDVYIKTLRGTW